MVLLTSYAIAFFIFLWFIRWKDDWGKTVQRRKLKDLRYDDWQMGGWHVFDESDEKWKAYMDSVNATANAGWRSTLERNAGKQDDSDDDPDDEYVDIPRSTFNVAQKPFTATLPAPLEPEHESTQWWHVSCTFDRDRDYEDLDLTQCLPRHGFPSRDLQRPS